MIEVIEVKSSKEMKRFIDFPYKLYKDNKYWIPPVRFDESNTLRRDRNPAFEYCEAKYWLAVRDGEVVGRIAGIINYEFIKKWKKKNVRFGWIDFIDDREVSGKLLGAVESWAKEKGMEAVHGPLGFCDLDREGMLVEGFDEPGMMITIYNYPYYMEHLEEFGYSKDADWVEYLLQVPEKIPDSVERISNILIKKSKLKIMKAKKAKELLPYAAAIFKLINEAYKDLYGVVELSDKQIKAFTKQYFSFVNPDYVRLVLDENNQLAAFGIAMPSLSAALKKCGGRMLPFGFIYILKSLKKNTCLDLYLVAVRPDLQGKGVNALLMSEITKSAMENSIKTAETGPELEENSKVQALWKHYTARQHKRRRCYIKAL